MKKSHGPAFKKERIELATCSVCRGKAVVKNLFFDLACDNCNASGWVEALTGNALPADELVTQLSLRLQAAERQIQEMRTSRAMGPEGIYEEGNRRGAGGTTYTGD